MEFRADSGYRSVADVESMFADFVLEARKVPAGERLVIISDWRRCPVMASDACEHVLKRITANNPRVLRSAAIASKESPVAVLQFVRLVRDSKHPDRRLFFDEQELVAWLGECLTAKEAARLRAFLAYDDT